MSRISDVFQVGETGRLTLVRVNPEQRHPHRQATRDAHLVARHPDQPPSVRHQHDVITLPHREAGRHTGAAAAAPPTSNVPAAQSDRRLFGERTRRRPLFRIRTE